MKQYERFAEALSDLCREFGAEVIAQTDRCIALLSDLVPQMRTEQIAFRQALRNGIGQLYWEESRKPGASLGLIRGRAMDRLVNGAAMAEKWATFTIDCIEEALAQSAAEQESTPAPVEDPAQAYQEARRLYIGQGGERDRARAIALYWGAAEAGHIPAQLALGDILLRGKDTPPDAVQAMEWYRRAAGQGDREAMVRLARLLMNGGEGVASDPAAACGWYEQAANAGSLEAQYQLATCLFEGKGRPANPERAAYWMLKAALQGDASAQYQVALCYATGWGMGRDIRLAREWLQKAADQGHGEAKIKLDALK